MVGDLSRFTQNDPGAAEVPALTAEQKNSLLSSAASGNDFPSLSLEVSFAQWQQIWDALNTNPPVAHFQLTVNGTPVVLGLVAPLPELTKPCQS